MKMTLQPMDKFIIGSMYQVYGDFSKHVNGKNCLCSLKNVAFDNPNPTSYTDSHQRQLYLLRYFPAYLVEYFLIYKQLLESQHIQDNLNVLSVGCGCGVDFYALRYAMQDNNFQKDWNYTGVDLVDWEYRFLPHSNTKAPFILKDIRAHLNETSDKYNIIFFPKSIGEFPDDVFKEMVISFQKKDIFSTRVSFLNSLRGNSSTDKSRMKQLAQCLIGKGYNAEDGLDNYYTCKRTQGLKGMCADFIYPDANHDKDIKSFIENLVSNCMTFKKTGEPCEDDCDDYLNRRPMLTNKYLNYQILNLVK